ncbi:hypothetical protein ACFQS7_25210 [Dankookia sp. GCM10030260]|uniref:hypothetical protein n=1 Tax=Dankookia sp. GCM10030260 TaxID=3273390 RepID=UPI00362377B2
MSEASDRLARSLRSAALRPLYEAWAARRRQGDLPSPSELDHVAGSEALADNLALAEVEPGSVPPSFRLVRVGGDMERRAGRPLVGERIGADMPETPLDPLGGAAWAYRRVLASGTPSYEFAYFSLDGTAPMLFERLLLPVGRGGRATHLLVASLFSDTTPEPA